VRAEQHYVEGFEDNDLSNRYGLPNGHDHQINNWSTRVRGHAEWDARTQTDFGLIRAFIAMEGTRGPKSVTGEFFDGVSSYGSGVTLASAFIQISNDWGTYTAGKFGSFFDFFGSHLYGTRIGLEDGTTDPNLFAWTFAGGNGFSFSISFEDPDSTGRRNDGDEDYEGMQLPDGVANIRVDQGWGSAQIMGAVRQIHDKEGGPGIDSGEDDDQVGFAVGAGVKLGIPGGWEVVAQGNYSEGMEAYVWSGLHGLGDLDIDGVGGDSDTNLAWGVRGGIAGPIGANLKVWGDASFVHEEEEFGDDEVEFLAAGVGGAWTPVPGLSFGPEVAWNSFDVSGDDTGGRDTQDYDIWGVMWRVQRNF